MNKATGAKEVIGRHVAETAGAAGAAEHTAPAERACKRVGIVTSIHPDFNPRIWKHAVSMANVGNEVHLVCPWAAEPGEVRDGVVLHPIPRSDSRLNRVWQVPLRVFRTLLPLLPKFDLVHFHDLDLLPYMALVSLYRPVVYDIHENYPEEMRVKFYLPRPLRRPVAGVVRWGQFLLSLVVRNLVLVVNEQEEDLPRRWVRKVYVRNYASLSWADEVIDDYMDRADDVIFNGSQYVHNGTLLILDIAEHLRSICPQARLLVFDRFSDQQLRTRFVSERARRGLEDRIILLQSVTATEMMSVLNRAIIGLSPNLRVPKAEKAIPTKLFEYMAAALPIVASDLPNNKAYVEPHESGLLARPEDPATFAHAIRRLVDDRSYARRLGQNGQCAMRAHYSWESQMPALLDLYDKITVKA